MTTRPCPPVPQVDVLAVPLSMVAVIAIAVAFGAGLILAGGNPDKFPHLRTVLWLALLVAAGCAVLAAMFAAPWC